MPMTASFLVHIFSLLPAASCLVCFWLPVPSHTFPATFSVSRARKNTFLAMGPPLPPTRCGNGITGSRCKIEIELFLDLICPFSCKMFTTLYNDVLPEFTGDNDISFVLNHVIQPWHPQSTMVHEAALAVKKVAPDAYLAYINSVYNAFTATGEFKDEKTWTKTRMEIYDELLALTDDLQLDKAAVKALLMPTGKGGNEGNAMTQDLKWATKYHRTRGVHVTPTVFVNGLEANIVSSGWKKDEWLNFLSKKGEDMFQG